MFYIYISHCYIRSHNGICQAYDKLEKIDINDKKKFVHDTYTITNYKHVHD